MRPPFSPHSESGLSLKAALRRHLWFGDGPPYWAGSETADQAAEAHERLARFVSRNSEELSKLEQIQDCSPRNRCLSGACPTCMRAAQRFFVQEITDLLKAEFAQQPVFAVSLIVGSCADLNPSVLRSFGRQASYWLSECGIRNAFGGWDFSFNQPNWESRGGQWAYQLWLLVPGLTDEQKQALRQLASDPYIRRPLKVMPFDGNSSGVAYALKTDFVRRVSYVQNKEKNGRKRVCRNTTAQKLRVQERIDLYYFLDDIGLHARLFLTGARLVRSGKSAGIRLIGRTVRLDKPSV